MSPHSAPVSSAPGSELDPPPLAATGKTELFEALRKEFPEVPVVEEVARKVMREKGWTGADTGREGRQEILFWASLHAEDEAARGGGEITAESESAIISDRASLCALVYSNLAEQRLPPSDRHQYAHLLTLIQSSECALALARYRASLVILCEPVDMSWYADDGVRGVLDADGWEQVRRTYRDILDEVGVRYSVLDKGVVDLGARVEWAKRELREGR